MNSREKLIHSSFGHNLKITIFGGSHESYVGGYMDGFPGDFTIDFEALKKFMARRAPGGSPYSTPRKEADIPIFETGILRDMTTGEKISLIIENQNTRSGDYALHRDIPRPAHADFTGYAKYGDRVNLSGGGPFSARLTAPLCAFGAIATQFLEKLGIHISAHIFSVSNIFDLPFDPVAVSLSNLQLPRTGDFPTLSEIKGEEMKSAIAQAAAEGDSLGAVIEACILGLPVGIGGPMYDGLESFLSPILFGIPAVKGLEFGNGFEAAYLKGSENNDPFYVDSSAGIKNAPDTFGSIKTLSNNHGGILGGISSGMPLICRLAFKPTPSISCEQDSVSLSKFTNEKLSIRGRHDPCVALRAVPAVEAALALGILDAYLSSDFYMKA